MNAPESASTLPASGEQDARAPDLGGRQSFALSHLCLFSLTFR